jgi:AcrR family transcriptional regulator
MAKISQREQQRETTIEAIKSLARAQMQAAGTAGISLRGIARELGVTAPALYRYFADRDDLITDLLLDAFNTLADTMIAADAGIARDRYAERLIAVMLAYRSWALEHPTDFQLIYGNPIPGYVAPRERTVPAASRPFHLVVGILGAAHADGILQPPPEYSSLTPPMQAHLTNFSQYDDYHQPTAVLYISLVGWTRIHGMVMLELFEDTQPVIGDTEAFYRFEITNFCADMKLIPKN